MRIVYFATILSILFSCKGKEDKVIDLENIMPVSQYDKIQKTNAVEENSAFVPSVVAFDLSAKKITWDSVQINENLTIPERFSPKKTEKFTYWIEGKGIEYYRWSFSDSTKTMKAFLNWMSCYGDKCLMVELRKNANIQRNAVLIMQNDTSIIQIQSPFATTSELQKWKQLYFATKEAKWNYVITQRKSGKAVWSKFENEEETEFVQLEKQTVVEPEL